MVGPGCSYERVYFQASLRLEAIWFAGLGDDLGVTRTEIVNTDRDSKDEGGVTSLSDPSTNQCHKEGTTPD